MGEREPAGCRCDRTPDIFVDHSWVHQQGLAQEAPAAPIAVPLAEPVDRPQLGQRRYAECMTDSDWDRDIVNFRLCRSGLPVPMSHYRPGDETYETYGSIHSFCRVDEFGACSRVHLFYRKNFSRTSKKMVEKMYPRGNAPEYAFANERTTVSIASGYAPNANLTVKQLLQFKEFMEKTFERNIPGLQWIARGFKEINGSQLIYLEFQSNAVNTETRNIVLINALNDRLVTFNFNSSVSDYESHKAVLEQSQKSY